MYPIMSMTILIIMIILIMMSIIIMISKKSISDSQKSSPFECGFNPMSTNRMPFSTHFFLIAVIFLIFDIEIIIIMPMIMLMKTTIVINWMITVWMFIIILITGLYYEWNSGMLNWTL